MGGSKKQAGLDKTGFYTGRRKEWAENTCYTYHGAIQYYGPTEVCDLTTRTLALEKGTFKD